MKKKALIFAIVAAAFMLAGVNYAAADCYSNYGKIFYLYENSVNTSGNYGYVYIAPLTTLPTYSRYFKTYNKEALAVLAAALAAGKTVYAWGDAKSCPTSGTYRYGGNLKGFRIYSNR